MSQIFLVVRAKIKPEHVEEFSDFMKMHVSACKKREPGLLQFDIAEVQGEPNTFVFLEKYADEAALAEHQRAPTLAQVRENMQTWAETVHAMRTDVWPEIQPAS